MINVTELAAKKIKEIASEEGLTGPLRIKILGGGCSGYTNDLYFEDVDPTETDQVFETMGVRIVVDQFSLMYLDGSTVDFVEEGFTSGFKINNPAVTKTCGCGSSFQF